MALEARGGAESRDGHAMLVRPREQRHHLSRALRVDDGVRPAGRVVREVVRVLVEHRVTDADVPLVPEEGHELRLEIHVSHSITSPRLSAMPLYLSEADVEGLLTPGDAVPVIEESFRRLDAGVVENVPRRRLELDEGTFAIMAAANRGLGYAG